MQAATSETLREQLSRVNAELARQGRFDSFYTSLAAAWARYGHLTERQEAALRRSLDQRAQREAQRAQEAATITSPMPTGRVTVSGEILSTKWQDNDFGGAWKMLVKSDAGWKVYGTIPASIESDGNWSVRFEELKGHRVTFSATIEPKEAAFGFFSRPTKARVFSPVPVKTQGETLAPAPAPAAAPAAGRLADIIAKLQQGGAR